MEKTTIFQNQEKNQHTNCSIDFGKYLDFSFDTVYNNGDMHEIQVKILEIATTQDVTNMKLADLARILDISSLQKVKHHRGQLIKKGLLQDSNTGKNTRIIKNALSTSDLISIPILGAANAGPANIYVDGIVQGYLSISSALLPMKVSKEKLFALKVVGDSMNDANVNGKYKIENGDYVVADARPFTPRNGDYVVSLFSGKANIKRFYKEDSSDQIALISESTKDYPPIIVSKDDSLEYLTQAKIISVAKSPKID